MKVKIVQTVELNDDDRRAIAHANDNSRLGEKADHHECVLYIQANGHDFTGILREYYLAKSEFYSDEAATFFETGKE